MCVVLMFGGVSCEHDISIITAGNFFGVTTLNAEKINLLKTNCTKNSKKLNLFGKKTKLLSNNQKTDEKVNENKKQLENNVKVRRVYVDENNKWYLVTKPLTPKQIKEKKPRRCFIPVTILPNDQRLFVKILGILFPIDKIVCVIPTFHGVNGEDGSIQGLLQLAKIPYANSDVTACAVGLDKSVMKDFFRGIKAPILPSFTVNVSSDVDKFAYVKQNITKIEKMAYPLIVKPAKLGSSIGITVAKNQEELFNALEVAFSFDNKVVIEKALTNFYEVNCSGLRLFGNSSVSRLERPLSSAEILTFADKYLKKVVNNGKTVDFMGEKDDNRDETSTAFVECPFEKEIKKMTEKIINALDTRGVTRIDYLVTDEMYFVNEINVLPGNLSFHLWNEKYDRQDFLQALFDDAIEYFNARNSLTFCYHSNVLCGYDIKK